MRNVFMLWFGSFAILCAAQQRIAHDTLDTIVKPEAAITAIDTAVIRIDGTFFFEEKSQKFRLKDLPYAAKIDSLWLQQFYDAADAYDTIYKTITDTSIDDTNYDALPTDTLKARLERLNQKTPFTITYNPTLESVIKRFLFKRRPYMEKLMTLGSFYFAMFEQGLINHKVPLEVKYLPIVESALNPRAKSRVGATGLWQFMYATGKAYDLHVNSYVDERSDPIKATQAASKYLARLYRIFEDWDLALAAYNSGPGNVSKAIRRSGGKKNYWNLRPFLPRETAGYVPAFYATLYIFEYAKEHGFRPEKPQIPYFETDTIHVKQLITFDQIAEVLDVDTQLIRFFNPAYYLDIIPFIKGRQYAIRLPTALLGKFVANEKAIYAYAQSSLEKREKPLPKLFEMDTKITYRVKSGDYLGKIAKKYGVSVRKIKRWNGLKSDRLRIGQRLAIYPKKPVATKEKIPQKRPPKTYTVQKGDTLWNIAKKFSGISVQNIRDWNDIGGNALIPGTELKLCNC